MVADTDRLAGERAPRRGFSLRIPSIIGSGLWALSAKLVSQVAQLATFIIAAHVLTPAQFGFFAFSSAIAVFLVMLSEGGWAEFVMKSAEGEARLDQIASMSLVSGLLFMTVGLAAADVLYEVFAMRWEASLLALFSCWILPSALTTVYDGVLVHRGRLRQQAMIRIAAEAVGLVVAVFGLRAGWNVFALVAGRLVMQLVILSGSVAAIGFLGLARPSGPVLRDVLKFSRQIIFNRLIVFLRSYSGTLAVGGFLGLAEAGYYRAAERIVAAFSELIGEPARMLGWIVFRRAREEQEQAPEGGDPIARAGGTLFPALIAVAAPAYLGLAIVSDTFVEIALGEAWKPAALLVGILAAKQFLLAPSYMSEPLLSIRGKLRALAPVSLLNAMVSVGLILLLSSFGVVAVALGQCLAAAIALATSIWLQQRHGGVDWLRIARSSALLLVAIAAMMAAVFYLGRVAGSLELRPIFAFAIQVAAGAIVYLAAVLMLWKFAGLAWLSWPRRHIDDPA
ncbi:oligosaccharide flippase family protein [Chelativorans sp. AA-79]|uniref:oligosaccharide flippase family protein n=1 Tax=Chelativorans sp. AA-79 TaxID=3028735 RepID=UPI0023F8ECF1|nr:oligosaccharide flippase family protein [Chelativorans sp. AA-79]WEX10480.1 oligosaccharide flippase family protein [Chelativorans sp. AA-79]